MEEQTNSLCVKKELKPYQYFILYFFIYAFMGWVMETIYAICLLGGFHKRGFLLGPVCPLYGFGALILLLFLSQYKKKGFKLFCLAAIIFSAFEYLTGFALDALFKLKFWDYTQDAFNLNGRISIMYSFAWGIIAVIFLHHIHPFIEKIVKKIQKKLSYSVQISILSIFSVILVTDFVLSCIKYLTL